jgi:hypothetical protein
MKLVLEQGLLELISELSVPVQNLLLCQMILRKKLVPGQKLHTSALMSKRNIEILMEAATVLQVR